LLFTYSDSFAVGCIYHLATKERLRSGLVSTADSSFTKTRTVNK